MGVIKIFYNFTKKYVMKGIILTLAVLLFSISASTQTLEPIKQTIGKLNISVDPRMELLSIIQILSQYKIIERDNSYSRGILKEFKDFSSHEAILLTDKLMDNHGFSYDAPVTFMLYLSQPPELLERSGFSDYLIERAGGLENLNNYRTSIEKFARETDFIEFWNSKTDFYEQMVNLTIEDIEDYDLIKVIEDYFKESQNSYNIIISPSFDGGYGPRIPVGNEKYDIYSCTTVTDVKDRIPYLGADNLIYYTWHEFGHSFVNPLTEKYIEEINSYENLFEPISDYMDAMAYGSWETCVNEHIIRAVNIRLCELNFDSSSAQVMLNSEKIQRFIYIEPVIEKLKEFEKLRDSKGITFSEFYPEFINMFDDLVKNNYLETVNLNFMGPMNASSQNPKRVWIYPTNDKDTLSQKIAENYVKRIYEMFKSDIAILIPDTVALEMSLEDYDIVVYGTIESNLFLDKYKSEFPFRIENGILYADEEYKEDNIKFISCLPNPQDPKKGMVIYTAISNKNIHNINSVFHGPEDYIIFTDRENIIKNGYYNKDNGWRFD